METKVMVWPLSATFPSPAWQGETFSLQLGKFGGEGGEGGNLYPKNLGFLTILLQ